MVDCWIVVVVVVVTSVVVVGSVLVVVDNSDAVVFSTPDVKQYSQYTPHLRLAKSKYSGPQIAEPTSRHIGSSSPQISVGSLDKK